MGELCRLLIAKARRERRLRAGAVRIDSTLVEADLRSPSDSGLAGEGVPVLARGGKRLAAKLGGTEAKISDRSRAVGKRLRAIAPAPRPRRGEAQAELLALTGRAGRLLAASAREARPLAAAARTKARALARSGKAKARRRAARILASAERLETLGGRGEKVVEQIRKASGRRADRGSPRLALRPRCAADPRGQAGHDDRVWPPRAAGRGDAEHEAGGRRFILPPASAAGNRGESELLPTRVQELQRLGLSPREVALDGGFQTQASEQLAPRALKRAFIAGRSSPGSRRTRRRLARYRLGAEGRISHLKRRHGLGRSRLKGGQGERTWSGWAVFAYNAETYGR